MISHSILIDLFKKRIPKLVNDLHKGQCGRIGIIGGSKEYSGAPYFAGISALKVGCDLCYVLTCRDAAPIIKSYSPELIVFPLLETATDFETELIPVLSKMHSIVIGPGLGRTDGSWEFAKSVISHAKEKQMSIILDADALFMLSNDYFLIDGYKKCILTPNKMEFKRLYEQILNVEYEESLDIDAQSNAVMNLSQKLNNVTILKKGRHDIISDGLQVLCNQTEGSNRRCSGQGDILSGALGSFAYWTNNFVDSEASNQVSNLINPNLLAAYCASTLVRTCNNETFLKKHRSMLTTDMINEIPNVFFNLFDF